MKNLLRRCIHILKKLRDNQAIVDKDRFFGSLKNKTRQRNYDNNLLKTIIVN